MSSECNGPLCPDSQPADPELRVPTIETDAAFASRCIALACGMVESDADRVISDVGEGE